MTLDVLNNYGILCCKLGDPDRAKGYLSTAREHLKCRKRMADGLYLNAAENLGNLHYEMRDYTKAKEILNECLIEAEERFPDRARLIRHRLQWIEGS